MQFWKLTYEDRRHYKDKVEELLGYLPTPYMFPRTRDMASLCQSRRARTELREREAEQPGGRGFDPRSDVYSNYRRGLARRRRLL